MKIKYGKETVTKSYHDGEVRSTKIEYSIPFLVKNKAQALNEVMKCLDMLDKKECNDITIKVETDPKTHAFKLITKVYTIDVV